MYPLSALLIPLPLIPFTTEEFTGYVKEAAKGPSKQENPSYCFFI